MGTIVGGILVRNEAGPDRYLQRALKNAAQFCDEIIVLDDGSTDDTARLASQEPSCRVFTETGGGWWGKDESPARARLWEISAEAAGPDGWVYIFDADHELVGVDRDDLLTLCQSKTCNAWAFPLWDCWDADTLMRVDGYWQAHLHPRPWLLKAQPEPGFVPEWGTKAIHVGHVPPNYPQLPGLAPGAIRHLGYVREEHRLRKHAAYTNLKALSSFERAHAESIVTEPVLVPTPDAVTAKILVGVPVRKPPVVIEQLLRTLDWQATREAVDLEFLFVPNFADTDPFAADTMALLEAWEPARGKKTIAPNVGVEQQDYADGEYTRQWAQSAFDRMAALKNGIFQYAINQSKDFVWLVDADVMCGPETLQSLLDTVDYDEWKMTGKTAGVVSAVYWTDWQRRNPDAREAIHAAPQVWLVHPYQLSGRGWEEHEFRAALVARKRVEVWGLGACTLVPVDALRRGLSFARVEGLGQGPMSEGEDRHFCARATQLHIPLIADAWPNVYHAYHPADYDTLAENVDELQTVSRTPEFGDLVSCKLHILEPVPDPHGRWMHLGPSWIRGRYGSLPILPEAEEALGAMVPGETRLMKLYFPAHWPSESLRLRTVVARLTLCDARPFDVPPVVRDELFWGTKSRRLIDHTEHTREQLVEMAGDGGT